MFIVILIAFMTVGGPKDHKTNREQKPQTMFHCQVILLIAEALSIKQVRLRLLMRTAVKMNAKIASELEENDYRSDFVVTL